MSSIALVVSLTAGVTLSVLFYGGLWITIQRLVTTRHPIAVTLGSLLFRMAVVLGGLILVSRGRWQNAFACLAGFAIGRIAVSRYLRVCT
jgi:F1F0 ATPase subunit 2